MALPARVKSILSGDTIVLVNPKNPNQECSLSLAYVSAPRLRREGDEPFAFQSREFLRKALLGKIVDFKVLYTTPTTKREYGIVRVREDSSELPAACVSEGWVKVREDAGKRDESEYTVALLSKLRDLEDRARTESKGLWASGEGRIETVQELVDAKGLVEAEKGKKIDAIVENVRRGDRLSVRLLVSPHKHILTSIYVAGIRAPSAQKVNPDGTDNPDYVLGETSRREVEAKLLQREVGISLLGVSPDNQLIANVIHPLGNIASFLLKAGLAQCFDHHSTLLGPEMAALRSAEIDGKNAKAGLFKDHKKAPARGPESDFIVSSVATPYTLFLRTKTGKDEKKVNLSSVRYPKPNQNNVDDRKSSLFQEAQEFMRKKLIGKHVKVKVDGVKSFGPNNEEREVATVMLGNENVALSLVEAGYAGVIRHGKDATDRSPHYDELLQAEATAMKEKRGTWSPKPPTIVPEYKDYSNPKGESKKHIGVLQRQKKVPAIIDFVKSGSRFNVILPKEHAKLSFVLGGIEVPRSASKINPESEPFGQEAHDFTRRRCLQREVQIDFERANDLGSYYGTLYVGGQNFAKALLAEGLAALDEHSERFFKNAGKNDEYRDLENLMKDAQNSKKGMWQNWHPSQDRDNQKAVAATGTGADAGAEVTQRKKDYRDVMVTDVDDSGKLKLQQIGAGTTALTEMMSAFRSFHINKANDAPLPGPPKAGDLVAAKFTEDDEWYRAKIRRNDRDAKKADVVYIDYGNSETLPWSRLRPLSQPQFSVQKLRPQASDAVLSLLQLPVSPGYLRDAVSFIKDETFDRRLVANVDYTSPEGTMHVTIFDPAISKNMEQSINADVVSEGLAMVPRKLKPWELSAGETLANLRKLETEAKEQRLGMWEYGDLTED
ncbi:hypothetical protein FQN50_002058 [Emmonsiellopsis sp. PD_5]|nr:hypothetical protein FQN50_002058 [Emmonsiellopsis sp. PD_5]